MPTDNNWSGLDWNAYSAANSPAPGPQQAPAGAPAPGPRYDPMQDPMMNLNASQIDAISQQQPKQQQLARQMAQADALRGTAMPHGRMVSGHYIKPSTLDSISSGTQQILGAIEGGVTGGQQNQLGQQGGQNQMALINALRGQISPGSPGAEAAGGAGGLSSLPFGIGGLV